MDTDSKKTIESRIRQARGLEPADLVIKKATVFYLASGELRRGDIAVCGDTIVGVDENYDGKIEIDGSGLTAVPGFIDSHVHVESTMLTPYEYERAVLPHGVTTAICDPHELANVSGIPALQYFTDSARLMLMDLQVQLSSCVPAGSLETSGAQISATALRDFKWRNPDTGGLAEMMNFRGVLELQPDVVEKLFDYGRDGIDGHCPLLSGKDLNAYIAAGINNCHEVSNLDEAFEKIRKGMNVFIREGSVSHDLELLFPLITVENSPFISFCSDDRNIFDIMERGNIDYMIRRAIAFGADPLAVYRAASCSPARIFNLKGRGLIAPGYKADIVLVHYLDKCDIKMVLKNGKVVNDKLFEARPPEPDTRTFRNSIKARKMTPDDFIVKSENARTHVIGLQNNTIISEHLELNLPLNDGIKSADISQDVLKVAVIERHGKTNDISLGFLSGLGITKGALASSIAHDSHNLCVCGADDNDMVTAVNRVISMNGGLAVVDAGTVLAALPLPIGGLISEMPFDELSDEFNRIRNAVRMLGSNLSDPFQFISFVSLSVLPHIRLTDRGLIDVNNCKFITE